MNEDRSLPFLHEGRPSPMDEISQRCEHSGRIFDHEFLANG